MFSKLKKIRRSNLFVEYGRNSICGPQVRPSKALQCKRRFYGADMLTDVFCCKEVVPTEHYDVISKFPELRCIVTSHSET